jgi:hypothetical protein
MFCLPDGDLWKIETCWRRNILIIKLHIDIVHLVSYNNIIYKMYLDTW